MRHVHSIALALHGGAGAISRATISPPQLVRYRRGLKAALAAGWDVLKRGGPSLDAVCAAVCELEDNPLFNAGRGAALNTRGEAELDASVMDGATLAAGAVAAVRHARNPVLVARAVMECTPHVLLAGAAADAFTRLQGLPTMPAEYFLTAKSKAALARMRAKSSASEADRHGTVGAVALDRDGNLAAATSTGGYNNKMPGRVGDSAVIGAGTYADNGTCAVSCTGHGETFIRAAIAHDIAARIRYGAEPLRGAVEAALATVRQLGANGGVIAVDRHARIAVSFNSTGMYRAYVSSLHKAVVAVY